LEEFLKVATRVSSEYPVVVSEYLENFREAEVDGVANSGEVIASFVTEHVENAGVHSGDATVSLPPHSLMKETIRKLEQITHQIAKALRLHGPFNIQFLVSTDSIKVIECNARASRSFPFVSKVAGTDLVRLATQIMCGTPFSYTAQPVPWVGVKASMFSFTRLMGSDPVLGVEMRSTGEVAGVGRDFDEALLLALEASGIRPPRCGILVSSGRAHEKKKFLEILPILTKLGIPIYGTPGTAEYCAQAGFAMTALDWPGHGENNAGSIIQAGKVDFIINIPKDFGSRELTHGAHIRQLALRHGISLMTDMEKAVAYFRAIGRNPKWLRDIPLNLL